MNARSSLRLVIAVAVSVAGLLCMVPAGPAAAADGCSIDTFPVSGTPVRVTLCAAPLKSGANGAASATVTETIDAAGQSFVRTSQLDFFDGATTSRSIDDIPLAKVGLPKTLHVTIDYRAGAVRIEHALLVPGAIALK